MNRVHQRVLRSLQKEIVPEELAAILWWVATVKASALAVIEERGLALAEAMVAGDGVEDALEAWLDAITFARAMAIESGAQLERRPVWAFWTLFTRRGQEESALSHLLREEIGYPTDEEAALGEQAPAPEVGGAPPVELPPLTTPGPCFTCGSTTWWKLEGSAFVVCAGCYAAPPGAEIIGAAGGELQPEEAGPAAGTREEGRRDV